MIDPALDEYARRKGWTLRPEGRNLVLVETCPFCDHRGKLKFLAATGQWKCWHAGCDKAGNVLTLKRALGDLVEARPAAPWSPRPPAPEKVYTRPPDGTAVQYHLALMAAVADSAHAGRAALDYLTAVRGFTVDTLRRFQVGYARRADGSEWVSIPSFDEAGCCGIKFRSVPPAEKKYIRWPDCRSTLFRPDGAQEAGAVIVCEGELDAMAWAQMGFPNVVSGSAGAGTWLDEWTPLLAAADTIYVALDGDEAGRAAALTLAEKLGRYRCRLVSLPLKDANDCLAAGYDHARMQTCLANAEAFGFRDVKHVRDLIPELLRERERGWRGESTGLRDLDDLLGGWRPDEVTVLTGDSGSGKSTLAAYLAYLRASALAPAAVLVCSFEMSALAIVRKLLAMESGQGGQAPERLGQRPIWLLDLHGEVALPVLRDSVYFAVRSRRCQMVVLDHLHFFLGSPQPEAERSAIGAAMRAVKQWARDLQVPIVLVAHPGKAEHENAIVTPNTLRGSSEIKQLADNILSIWRERPGGEMPGKVRQHLPAEVAGNPKRVALFAHKIRSELGREGALALDFDLATQSYLPLGAKVVPMRAPPAYTDAEP